MDKMASGAKRKTTFSKLAREQKLRERRQDKQAKKDARKRAATTEPMPPTDEAASAPSGTSSPAQPISAAR
jgi:hypothetical protein